MNLFWHKVEHYVDRLIPFSLMLLLFIIVSEIFFHDAVHPYTSILLGMDYGIWALFLADLIFKYLRIRKIPRFLRECWLEIIAVLPFALMIRVLEVFAPLSRLNVAADSAHGIIEAEARYGIIAKEAQEAGRVSRVVLADRLVPQIARAPRFAQAFTFYDGPNRNR